MARGALCESGEVRGCEFLLRDAVLRGHEHDESAHLSQRSKIPLVFLSLRMLETWFFVKDNR